MNDRMANLDFDVPPLPERKPQPEPTYVDMVSGVRYRVSGFGFSTSSSTSAYTLQTIADMQAAAWGSRATFPSAYQRFTTGDSWKQI